MDTRGLVEMDFVEEGREGAQSEVGGGWEAPATGRPASGLRESPANGSARTDGSRWG